MDFDRHIGEIEKKIGYTFKDKSLLRQAFTRSSFANENKGKSGIKYQSNEVLEFFGDSILSACIVTLLMRDLAERYEYGISTDLSEGDFSNIKSKLSDKKKLSLATKKLGLQEFLRLGEGDLKLGIKDEPSVMEDLFESIVGAIYIDSSNNLSQVISSVARMLDVSEYLSSKSQITQSAKNLLQEYCADKKHKLPAPIYKTVSESGPDHKKIYERACFIGDKIYGTGTGKNHKIADAIAAETALSALIAENSRKGGDKAPPAESVIQKLKEYAAKKKLTTPEFRDLGETADSTKNMPKYSVECRFAGKISIGVGQSKREAKLKSADAMLSLLSKKSKQAPAKKKQPARKANTQKHFKKKTAKAPMQRKKVKIT